jgi:soluble lytic murein transglycosylase-like protein
LLYYCAEKILNRYLDNYGVFWTSDDEWFVSRTKAEEHQKQLDSGNPPQKDAPPRKLLGSVGGTPKKDAQPASKGSNSKALPVGSKNANDLQGKAALNAMRGYFMELEKKYNLPPGLLYAVAMTESAGKRFAVSEVGAQGPFQFMPPTAKAYGLKGDDVFDWYKSADAAAKMYGSLSKQFNGDLDKMLAGYNWGTGNMSKYGMKNMPKQTREYIPKVEKYREEELRERKAQGFLQSLSDVQARMNQPLVPNMDMQAANDFLSQTPRIQSMPMASVNNKTDITVGDINVFTTANTLTGNVTDGGEAIRTSLSQIIPSMS